AFYLVNENELNLISTYGISEKTLQAAVEPDLYSNVINKKENIEIIFEEDFPSIKTGLLEIDIKYLLVIPIVFDKKVISVIEIASEHIPTINPKEYLDSIKEQLAIGINNAASLKQLKDLVDELKILNDQYQKQNEKIVDQNEELKKLHTDLKEKANELEEQRRKAVELTHVKSQFLANMSHELRTPLNSIIGLTELISDDSTTFPKTKDRLNIVLRNGKKLLTLINNILEFSKIESGKYEITKSDFIISEFINDIYLAMEPLVVEKDLQLSIVFANDKDLLIHSDKHKLEQIILNLISNAIKFTEVGGIKINIDETNDKSLKIDVVDTGIGISDEDKRLIFEEFKQVEHSDTKKFQGAGLGLTICKKYISLLDGKILVQSNDFKGSTFTILLSNVIIDSLPLLEKFRYQQNSSSKQINRKKLLLIHNDNRNKIIIENYFEKSEYDVIQSKPNIEIVEQIGDVSLDGILINATNITKDYWDMLYELKSNQSTTNIPIGVMSFQSDGKKAYLLDVFDIVVGEENINKINYCIDIIKLNNNKAEKILWLGDDSEARKGTIDQLNGHIDTMTVSEVENISDTIDEFKPDILIVDMLIENDTNLKLLTYLHQTNKFPIITVIPDSLNELDKQKLITALDTMVLDFSKRIEDVFRTLDRKYSLVKKLKKSISFPLENRKFEDDTEASTSSGISQNENQFHILVVDDDKDTQFTVGEIIKNIGCSISFANNGAECLTMLKSTAPDLILLDIRMPVMDGFEAIKRIRSNKETEHMLVYAMTAQAMLDDFGIIKQNGFDDLITKPIDNSTLSFKIQQRIQKILK
ncbi:MAG: response regulator, partial [Bacteroidota bacterium]